jgi:hypothetical protein
MPNAFSYVKMCRTLSILSYLFGTFIPLNIGRFYLMLSKPTLHVLLVSYSLSFLTPAMANDTGVTKPQRDAAVYFLTPIFDIIDCESVGVIEDGDVDEHFTSLFFFNDRDQSRYIVESEFVRARSGKTKKQSVEVFQMMDTNSNGQVTPQEYRQFVSYAIKATDTDNNGELVEFEVFGEQRFSIKKQVLETLETGEHLHASGSKGHAHKPAKPSETVGNKPH